LSVRLAAYALIPRGDEGLTFQILGFETIEEARAWRETNHDWREFGWDQVLFREWRVRAGLAESEPGPGRVEVRDA
jgi:hypothetical protein